MTENQATTTGETQNDFLLELLKLQQDGQYAISAPTNWTREPLLEVETELDQVVNNLKENILTENKKNKTARWHFFIGSPGNGKSAAMGKLCGLLIDEKKCLVCNENDVPIRELPPTDIPYLMRVYEHEKKFATAWILQDASVVPNPFSSGIDPAKELLNTVKEAWGKGISLVVCANRGILEKAHRDCHVDPEINSEPWFKILAAIVKNENISKREFTTKKTVFSTVQITYNHLDKRSLLLKDRRIFEDLFIKATEAGRWESCSSCVARDMCPFKANRDWLVDDRARDRVLLLLTRAEVLSGQVIVFREALAIISFILAGCPSDYEQEHPCKWVQNAVQRNHFFSLATRRIYMCLFASYCPHGLEYTEVLQKRQVDALRGLEHGDINEESREAIKCVPQHAPSTDVGVTRLLGPSGIIPSLDPCREVLPSSFYEFWDRDYSDYGVEMTAKIGRPLFTPIEEACISTWKHLEEHLESAAEYSVADAYWALRRWSSNFLLHFGALFEGRSAWCKELDEFTDLLKLVDTSQKSSEETERFMRLDNQMENLLNSVSGGIDEVTVKLSETVTLSGRWVQDKLKPKTVASEKSASVSLAIEFGEKKKERAVFAAPMYLWLTILAKGKLDARCLPRQLLSGATDAQIRAASRGEYAFEDKDVELLVDMGMGEEKRFARLNGQVIERKP